MAKVDLSGDEIISVDEPTTSEDNSYTDDFSSLQGLVKTRFVKAGRYSFEC